MLDLQQLIRENIKSLKPYSSARSEFSGEAHVFLDANENSYGSPLEKNYNRYPDPLQKKLKHKIGELKKIIPSHLFLGNGSDECIDLLLRAFCNPGKDNILICPPTYGMYKVSAQINEVEVREAKLDENFQLQVDFILSKVDERTKLLFICSPNNPSGNLVSRAVISRLLNEFQGLVVVDEAYIDFAETESFIHQLEDRPNLVVLQTFSKAWGLAGLRLGMLFGSVELVEVLNKIKPPYNINQATQEIALKALSNTEKMNTYLASILEQRSTLRDELRKLPFVHKVYPSDANFLLVKMDQAHLAYKQLVENGIVVRDRSQVVLCEDCLRITVGTREENLELIEKMRNLSL